MVNQLWKQIKDALYAHPEQQLVSDERIMKYSDVVAYAETLASTLSRGIFAIRCKNEMNTALAVLACFCARVTAVPLSDRYGELHCERILSTVDADFIVTDESGEIDIRKLKDSPIESSDNYPSTLIMYTSGTTGIPKGAMITERNILSNLESIGDYFHINSQDCIMIARPLYHCAVLTGEFLMSIIRGTRIVFHSGEFNPIVWANKIEDEQITVLGGTPTLFFNMSRLIKRKEKIQSLKKIVVSGERLTATVANEIHKFLPDVAAYSVYGLTEASPRVTYLPPALFVESPESCGFPIKNVQVRIIDDDGLETCPGGIGELYVKGDNIMAGYYKNSDATARVLNDGWLKTGDMAYKDSKGLIYIKGRRDDMIIHAGMNVYPQEIESVVSEYPGIVGVLVQGVDDSRYGQKIVMYVSGDNLSIQDIIAFCRQRLPTYEIPSEIKIIDEIPKNGSGKTIRKSNV